MAPVRIAVLTRLLVLAVTLSPITPVTITPVTVTPVTVAAIIAALLRRARFGCFHKRAFLGAELDHLTRTRRLVPPVVAIFGPVIGTIIATVLPIAPLVAVAVAVTVATVAVPALLLGLLALLALLAALTFVLFGLQFTLRLAQHAGVMLGMLHEVLGGHAVIRQLRITGEKQILLDDLLRRATHLALRAGAFEHAVDDIAERPGAVRFGSRAGLGRSHLVLWSRMTWLS